MPVNDALVGLRVHAWTRHGLPASKQCDVHTSRTTGRIATGTPDLSCLHTFAHHVSHHMTISVPNQRERYAQQQIYQSRQPIGPCSSISGKQPDQMNASIPRKPVELQHCRLGVILVCQTQCGGKQIDHFGDDEGGLPSGAHYSRRQPSFA
jgi:hypothetical protein